MAENKDMTKKQRLEEVEKIASQSMPTETQAADANSAKVEAERMLDIKPQQTYPEEIKAKVNAMPWDGKRKAQKQFIDWNNRPTYDPTNKQTQTEEEIVAEIESENPVEETIGDRLRASYGNDVNVQLGSDGKYYTGEGENPIQISAGSINTTYKDANGVEKQTKSDVYRLADGTYAYEDGNGNIQTLTEAQYQQAKQPVDDNARKAQSFRDEAFRQLRENPNMSDSELWVYLADKLGKNAYAKEQGLKFGNLFNWKNVVGKLREDFNAEQQRKLQQEQTISNELWNRDARGNLIEGGVVSIVGGKPKTIGDVNSLRRDLISFNEDATPEEKATLLNKHLPADKQITADEANTITDLRSAYNLLKTKGGEEFEEYMELGGVELDADGNVKVQKPIDNLEEYLSEYNTKEKEKLELDRAKAKRNLELRMEAFRDIAKNIGNTISVSMGANSLGTDNDNIYKNIEDKYRQKVLAYEAKMEQMRQEKMAEKQRREAMALQEAQMRAAAQKAAANRELEMWKTMAGLQNKKDLQHQKLKAEEEQKALDRALKNKELKFEQDKNSFYYDNDGYRFTIPKSHTDNMKSEFNRILRKYLPATKFNLSIYEYNLRQSTNPIHEIKGLLIEASDGNLSSTEQDDNGNYKLAEPISQEDYDKAITEISEYLNTISEGEKININGSLVNPTGPATEETLE
jgi:hypothetical protein